MLSDTMKLQMIWPAIMEMQDIANKHGIKDIFQDAGGKVLDICLATGLRPSVNRSGHDAIDKNGEEYEIKTLDIKSKATGFSTNHHVTYAKLQEYKQRKWLFVTYDGIARKDMYVVDGNKLSDHLFRNWYSKFGNKSHFNNPKVPLKLVREIGTKL